MHAVFKCLMIFIGMVSQTFLIGTKLLTKLTLYSSIKNMF